MGGSDQLTGPDLEKDGVALTELAEGQPKVGHALGEAVLLVRRGADVCAVGASCTHYGGPLGEGIVVGDEVRCPLHHARFDLRTGAAVAAPALNPLPCFALARRDGRVFVTGKTEPPRTARKPASSPSSVVVVGGGAAGAGAVEALRADGYAGPVTLVGRDPSVPYDRPNISKDYLAGEAPEEWIPLRDRDFYASQSIDLRLGVDATALDTSARKLTLSDKQTLGYGALILATGASPVRPPIPGVDAPHVRVLRTLADSRSIIAAAKGGARKAVVVGASFIGLEVAAALRTRGLDVDVVAPEARPLERVLGAAVAAFVKDLHASRGVRFHLGDKPASIEAKEVVLASGGRLDADLVVLGVGVRPDVQLAQQAGLAVDDGVLVDEHLETSAPGIYACGDIARYLNPATRQRLRVEHWIHAERQGQVAAANVLGARRAYTYPPVFWSQHYDVRILYVGHADKDADVQVLGDPKAKDCAVVFRGGAAVQAIATIGRDRLSLKAEDALERGDMAALASLLA
jgi:NADPH-dependent 2,4-dienoyl-CoA reductase/sulfur reductase-like enzyme/nitrite reductase/ring-hydroxylating ferredoxin subunit